MATTRLGTGLGTVTTSAGATVERRPDGWYTITLPDGRRRGVSEHCTEEGAFVVFSSPAGPDRDQPFAEALSEALGCKARYTEEVWGRDRQRACRWTLRLGVNPIGEPLDLDDPDNDILT